MSALTWFLLGSIAGVAWLKFVTSVAPRFFAWLLRPRPLDAPVDHHLAIVRERKRLQHVEYERSARLLEMLLRGCDCDGCQRRRGVS